MTKAEFENIRPAHSEDLVQVIKCMEEAYTPYIASIGVRAAPMDADYRALIDGGHVLVTEMDDQIVAFVVRFFETDHLLLETVGVLPSYEGRGIAKRLFKLLEIEAQDRGLSRITLYTNARMERNISLYQHLGWVITGSKMIHGREAVFMDLDLSSGC